MSGLREENIRVRIQALSELPEVADQLQQLIALQKQQILITDQYAKQAAYARQDQMKGIEGVTSALKEQQNQQKKSSDDTTDGLKKASAGYEDLGKTVRNFATLVAGAFTLNEIKNFGLDVIDAKTKIDQLKISLDVMLGSKAESAKLYQDIVKLAKETPYSLEEVAEQVVKLKAYNVATSDLIPTITNLGNAAATVGKEKLPQITLAYGQIMNMGKLMGAEARQLIEAGLPIYDMLATSMGKAKAEVIDMAAKHIIMAADVKKAFEVASAEGGRFANIMTLQSKTVGGEVDRLKDSYQQAQVRIGDFFENQIKAGTRRMTELMNATIGSNTAIERTLNVVKAVAAAVLTYTIATKAQQVASAALAGYEAAKNVIYGTYLLTLRAVTGQQVVYTAAQTEATLAARGFGLALAANPVGAAITAIGLLVTAYYSYKAITDEVTTAMGEEEIKLKSSQTELNGLTKAAMGAAVGTKQRKDAIDLLIQKYPEYFSGINSETATNGQLKKALDSVNASYQTRISLARQAYKLEGISNEQKELLEKEAAFFSGLPKSVTVQFGGDIQKFVETLNSGSVAAQKLKAQLDDTASHGAEFFGIAAKSISGQFKKIEGDYAEVNTNMQKSDTVRVRAAEDTENVRWENQLANLKKGSGEYKVAEQAHLDNLAKINGTYQEAELKQITSQGKAKVEKAKLTAAEVSALLKENDAVSLKERMSALDAEEKVEIAAANKAAKNKQDARSRILAIDAEYDKKRAVILEEIEVEEQTKFLAKMQETNDKVAVLTAKRLEAEKMLTKLNDASTNEERLAALKVYHEKFKENLQDEGLEQLKIQVDNSKKLIDDIVAKNGERGDVYRAAYAAWLKDDEQYNAALTKQTIDAVKSTAQSIKEHEKEIQDAHKETAKLEEGTLKQRGETRKQFLSGFANMIGQEGGFLGQMAAGLVSIYSGLDGLELKALAGSKAALKGAEDTLTGIKSLYDGSTAEGAAKIAQAEQGVAKSKAGVAEAEAVTASSVLGIMGTVYQVFSAIASAYNQMMAETYQAIADGLGKARQSYNELYDFIAKASQESHREEMASFNGTIDEKLKRIDEYYAQEEVYAKGQTLIDNKLEYYQKAAQMAADAGTSQQKITEGFISLQLLKIQQVLQAEIDAGERSKQAALEKRDSQIAAIDAELAAFKAAKQAETDAEKQSLSDRKAANEVFFSDKQLRLQEDDTYRALLLKQGEDREVAALEAAKQRELERARVAGATAQEIQEITTAFDKLIADKHAEYQTAIGDKTKAVSLANQETKAQEKDNVNALEKDSADKITALQKEIEAQELSSAQQKKKANFDYKQAVLNGEREIFEAQKSMQVSQLQAEIAILRSKRNFLNAGKINSSIADIEGAINTIQSLSYSNTPNLTEYLDANGLNSLGNPKQVITLDGSGNVPPEVFDKDGNPVQLTYKEDLTPHTVYRKDGTSLLIAQASGFVPKTGERFFKGTDYLELGAHPEGRDTIPVMANKGERILPTDHNLRIGGRGLTNEQLVHKIKFFDKLAADFPHLVTNYEAMPLLKLPAGIMNSAGGNTLDVSGLRDDLRAVKQAVENKKLLSLNVDANGFSTALIGKQSQTTYYGNLFQQ